MKITYILLSLLMALSGSSAFSESLTDVLLNYGISENIDQWGHYLLGMPMAASRPPSVT